jgi:RNA polymerase sigma-B factor
MRRVLEGEAVVRESLIVVDRGDRERGDRLLFARRDAGDPRAREALVERFLPLARSMARRYERSGEPIDDLIQVASLALVKAIDRFDPAHGSAFSSFAVPTITGELKRHFRDRGWIVRPPRDLQERTLRVDAALQTLTHELDRSPTVSELAAALGSDDEHVLEALQARAGRTALSLSAPSNDDDERPALERMLGDSDDAFATAESRVMLDGLMRTLTPRSREVLRLRFEEDRTQAEIGQIIGVSQMQVSRIIRQALRRLRAAAEPPAGRSRRLTPTPTEPLARSRDAASAGV